MAVVRRPHPALELDSFAAAFVIGLIADPHLAPALAEVLPSGTNTQRMLRRLLDSMFGKTPGHAQQGANYVYKIVPHSSVNPRYTFPVPIPASHTFVLSELDAKDGFLHMSTAGQLAGTLNRFFRDNPKVVLLKMDYARLSGFKIVKWEPSGGGEIFPHLYAQLEGENVEDHLDLEKKPGETTWDAALERARRADWLKD